MTKIRLDYIHEFLDRHGKIRRYVRLPGRKRVPLKGVPGSEEFMTVYLAALAGEVPRVEIGAIRTKPGTVNAAIVSYFNSAVFQASAPDTRRTRRNILERFRTEHGDKRIALLQRMHIDRMVVAKAGTPSAARNFLNTLRAQRGVVEARRVLSYRSSENWTVALAEGAIAARGVARPRSNHRWQLYPQLSGSVGPLYGPSLMTRPCRDAQ
jgi:hypothetical protein